MAKVGGESPVQDVALRRVVIVDPPASYLVAEDPPERSAVAANPEPEFVEREAARAVRVSTRVVRLRHCPILTVPRDRQTDGVRAATRSISPLSHGPILDRRERFLRVGHGSGDHELFRDLRYEKTAQRSGFGSTERTRKAHTGFEPVLPP